MSVLRPQQSLRLGQKLKSPSQPLRGLSTTSRRNAEDPHPEESSMIQVDHKPEAAVREYYPKHQPDYNATIDHGTSTYSPVPRRVMNGSEPGDITPAAVLSGAPVDLQARVVRIYKQAKPATQSGGWGSHSWRIDWDPLPKGHRWENPLMGWQSSGDFMQGTKIPFKTKEDAVRFAQRQGYEYYVQEPQERRFVPKAYANMFLHEPGPLKHLKTK